jgi:hypothetical protein
MLNQWPLTFGRQGLFGIPEAEASLPKAHLSVTTVFSAGLSIVVGCDCLLVSHEFVWTLHPCFISITSMQLFSFQKLPFRS